MEKKFKDLLKLAKMLRSEKGCPWDRKQNIPSMAEHLEEEAGEVKEAIQNLDYPNLQEELGDLLFQIIMISQIADEDHLFNMDDVIRGIDEKIRSRHTWVFGKDKAATPEEALEMWKRNKEKEKK